MKLLPISILQSTSLIRGKTAPNIPVCNLPGTSIHFPHPREDSTSELASYNGITSIHFPHPREDSSPTAYTCLVPYFNPLPSSEGRHSVRTAVLNASYTSIHFPHPREDRKTADYRLPSQYFNPLPSSEGRQQNFLILFSNPNIFLVHLYNFIFYLSNSQKKSRNSAIKP